MSFFKKLFGGQPEPAKSAPAPAKPRFTHLVQVRIPLANGPFGDDAEREQCQEVEDRLAAVLAKNPIGEVDGHDVGGGTYLIWLYGSDAGQLATLIRENLPAMPPGTSLFLRHGDVEDRSAREETIPL